MPGPRARLVSAGAIVAAVIVLPAVGATLAGRSLGALLQFPPRLGLPPGYVRFSWIAVAVVLAPLLAVSISWMRTRSPRIARARASAVSPKAWPVWGSAAIAWILLWWLLAWTRFDWFAPLQRFTFFPLWLGYIAVVNALTLRRTGSCLLLARPRYVALLFGMSAVFWWLFEWLNRFALNWHYLGVQDLGSAGYVAQASLCFSTVLPAVASTREWVGSFPEFATRAAAGPRWSWLARRATGGWLAAGGCGALLGVGVAPQWLYPALWLAPLALMFGAGLWWHQEGLWSEIARGDWRAAASWMTAALICGFFWEMWNVGSAAKWIYTVPFVQRWHVFEMPMLGYAGYLPFGWECACVVWLLESGRQSMRSAPVRVG